MQNYPFFTRAIRVLMPAACVMCFAVGAEATIVIDDFTTTQDGAAWIENLTENNQQTTRVELFQPLSNAVLGGKRTTTLRADHIGVEDFDFVRGVLAPSPGIFDYASTANARGTLSFRYDGIEQSFAADLSEASQIHIGFTFFDFANGEDLPVTITLNDGQTEASQSMSLGENELDLYFSLTDFGGVDLSSITSIEVEFSPGMGADFRLGHMAALPAPGILAVMGIGAIALGRNRRRNLNR